MILEYRNLYYEGFDNDYILYENGMLTLNGVEVKVYDNGRGYLVAFLYKGGKLKRVRLHRLVAQLFISNPNNLPVVNHKDGNKHNNSVSNLEWVSYKDNTAHYINNELKTTSKQPIALLNKNGKIKHVFTSIKEASEVLNLCYRSLFNAVQNGITYKGMIFKKCKIELIG